MKKLPKLSDLKNPLEGASFEIGGKKVKESRFWKEIANEINPPKKRKPKERTFSLQEALEIWEAGMEFQYTETRRVLGLPTNEIINKEYYFKEKFNIDLKK